MTSGAVTSDDVEREIRRLSGWRADQVSIDRLMVLVNQLAGQAGQDGGAERPSAGLSLAGVEVPPGQAVQAEDGTLWLHLGTHQVLPSPTVGRDVHTRMCRLCMGIKDIDAFRKEAHSRGGWRAECRDCENEQRQERKRRHDHQEVP